MAKTVPSPAAAPAPRFGRLRAFRMRLPGLPGTLRSLTFKNLGVFLVVFLLALAPMVHSYWRDLKENRIDILGGQLEVIAMHTMAGLRAEEIAPLIQQEMTGSLRHQELVNKLKSIQQDYNVDHAGLIRREPDGRFTYIADGDNQFRVKQPVEVHQRFPGTQAAAQEAWATGVPMRTGLFGDGMYDFLQIYYPIVSEGEVVAVLLIDKFAIEVNRAIRKKTRNLVLLASSLFVVGGIFFLFFSTRMLAPLLRLKKAALRVAAGDLEVSVPPLRRRDEVSELNESFRTMLGDLRRQREELEHSNEELKRTLSRVRMMEDLERNLANFVPREVSQALHNDPEALARGKTEKDVTVVFLDIEGSSRFAEALDPRGMDRMIEVYFSKFLDAIYENQGDITETAGDGLMIVFQGEDSDEHACNAFRAAAAIQSITRSIQNRLTPGEERVLINIGINSGKALVGFSRFRAASGNRFTFTASGRTTIIAARLADLATQGSILMGAETVKRLSRGGEPSGKHKLESLGSRQLKNINAPEEVYRLAEAAPPGAAAVALPEEGLPERGSGGHAAPANGGGKPVLDERDESVA